MGLLGAATELFCWRITSCLEGDSNMMTLHHFFHQALHHHLTVSMGGGGVLKKSELLKEPGRVHLVKAHLVEKPLFTDFLMEAWKNFLLWNLKKKKKLQDPQKVWWMRARVVV